MVAVAHVEGGRRERVGPSPLGHLDLLIARNRGACLAENRAVSLPGRKFISPFWFWLWLKWSWLFWFAWSEV